MTLPDDITIDVGFDGWRIDLAEPDRAWRIGPHGDPEHLDVDTLAGRILIARVRDAARWVRLPPPVDAAHWRWRMHPESWHKLVKLPEMLTVIGGPLPATRGELFGVQVDQRPELSAGNILTGARPDLLLVWEA